MTIYLLTADPSRADHQTSAIEERLLTTIPELRTIENLRDITGEISANAATKIVVIFVSPDLPRSGLENFINIASRYRHSVFFVLVSNEISGADYKRLIQSGGADWVDANGTLEDIPELIDRHDLRSDSASQPQAKPTIVSFLPAMGGVGNTTIAVEVALRIKIAKASRSWKICYVDFDYQTSHVCDYLDIDARFQIHEILERPERLDEHLFELFVSHHKSGLDLFAAPRSKLDPCDVDPAVLDPFLEMVWQKYNYIIFDMPVPWFNWTIPVLQKSDAIILTGINTIPCLRQMKATLDEVLKVKSMQSQAAIAMNRVTHRLVGGIERRGHVESVFPNETIFYLAERPDAAERVNTGNPAALGANHPKDFEKLTSYCAGLRQAQRTTAG